MTPEIRAARDRLARFAGPDFPMPALELPDSLGQVTVAEARRLVDQSVQGVRETLVPDLCLVLAALDRALPTRYDHQLYGGGHASGQCEDCFCCTASGCHAGPDATCPTDRLGDSVCPCTGD